MVSGISRALFFCFEHAFSGHMGFLKTVLLSGTIKMTKKTSAEKWHFRARAKIEVKNRMKKEGRKI